MSFSTKQPYTITEYDGFVRGKPTFAGYQTLPERTFDALENFILANRFESNTDAAELLSLSARHGRKIITARNYVGLITMKDGTVIEILPKIYGGSVSAGGAKSIFLEMLRTVKDASFKSFNTSTLKTERLSLFEIFISMFAAEAAMIVKQGLKSSYIPVEANERFFKGKLNAPQNIKLNYVSRERFFVSYDEWSANCPENRLLKTTLQFLLTRTHDDQNRLNISRLLTFFNTVLPSADYEADFSKCVTGRSMSHYSKALSWCRVFLRGNSFTPFAGSEIALALLFPMEKVFESYVAAKLRRHVPADVDLRMQDTRRHLFDRPEKAFGLRPDIVLTDGNETVVIDTKWKLLSSDARTGNYGISQPDMYQMYAYGKKYGAKKVILLYPQPGNLREADIAFHSDDGVSVEAAFIDLLHPDEGISALIRKACYAWGNHRRTAL